MADVLRINPDADDDRFARFRLISWWDQARLSEARVLVIGAGALGNEILKNLALLGIGLVFVADLDRVANSNLSRSVLFREADCGRPKVEVVAARARELYPAMRVEPFFGNIVYDLGLGIYRWADIIIGGLDNREARVAINQATAHAGKTWIDGAIERLDGVARVFTPASGPCYECTMSAVDWQMLEARRSCALLTRQEMEQGKTPTTPTTAAVIAGIQCQEAVKFLHGLETLAGGDSYSTAQSRKLSSQLYAFTGMPVARSLHEPVQALSRRTSDTQAGTLLERIREDLGPTAVLEMNQDLLGNCAVNAATSKSKSLLSLEDSEDQAAARHVESALEDLPHHRRPRRTLTDRTLRGAGRAGLDILGGRAGMKQTITNSGGQGCPAWLSSWRITGRHGNTTPRAGPRRQPTRRQGCLRPVPR